MLSPREVVPAAVRAGARHWRRVLGAAVVVFGISAAAETAMESLPRHPSIAVAVPLGLLALATGTFGEVFFAGLLERLVGEAAHGGGGERVGTVLRTLPYGRLILADLLVALLVLVGTLALLVPGLVLFNLLALSGPIVNIENRTAVHALRRSARLVRRHFWTVALLVTLPVWAANTIADAVVDAAHGLPIAAGFAIRFVVSVVFAIGPGLVQVELTYRLIEVEGDEPAPVRSPR